MSTFTDKLNAASARNRSHLVVGLDPQPSLMDVPDVAAFNRAIIEATADLVCAYKPQMAYFEALGMDGLRALETTFKAIPAHIPVILDAKRGDIGSTSAAYARAVFEVWGADATTVHPYMGEDSVGPFLEYREKGVFILARTSNPGARDFEELTLRTPTGERPLYEQVVTKALEWNDRGNVGLVVGATAPEELARVRSLAPNLPLLIPGIGAQGGDLEASVRNGRDARGGGFLINAARSVLYASRGADFAEAARAEAERLRAGINAELARLGA